MALKSPLGFGMMRLPIKNNDPTNFDYEQLNPMVDAFLDAGYTYFDTSFVYHNGKSEEATRKAVVERHPRDSFTVATKFPTFILEKEEQIETIFAQQLQNLGVDYIDYYLLHLINTVNYEGVDGKGGIVKTAHLFEHAKQWLADGKIKHLGFSFHASAKQLDRVLGEHPEVEFVQIALNYIDWESEFVQAKACYEVIRKGIANLVNAIQAGILTASTKERLEQLEKEREELTISIAQAQLARPKYTKEQIVDWISQFKYGNINDPAYQKQIIETFVNSVYLYEDHLILNYNYKNGTETFSLDEVNEAFGSDLKNIAPPEKAPFANGAFSISTYPAIPIRLSA